LSTSDLGAAVSLIYVSARHGPGQALLQNARGSQRDGCDNLDKQAVVITLTKQAPQ